VDCRNRVDYLQTTSNHRLCLLDKFYDEDVVKKKLLFINARKIEMISQGDSSSDFLIKEQRARRRIEKLSSKAYESQTLLDSGETQEFHKHKKKGRKMTAKAKAALDQAYDKAEEFGPGLSPVEHAFISALW